MTMKITSIAASLKTLRLAPLYGILGLVTAGILLVSTASVFGQNGIEEYRALKGLRDTESALAKGYQQGRVYHTNGALWNSWDNLGNTGDISCSAAVPGFTYPGGTVLNYLCRGGYWIVAKSNTENGLVGEDGVAST